MCHSYTIFFFFNDTATTEIYTLSLHDALPILTSVRQPRRDLGRRAAELLLDETTNLAHEHQQVCFTPELVARASTDRKSTRLNSSHANISYAVFCLKKKK